MAKRHEDYDDYYRNSQKRGIFYGIALVLVAAAGLAGITLVIAPCSNRDGDEGIICSHISSPSSDISSIDMTQTAIPVNMTLTSMGNPPTVVTVTPEPQATNTLALSIITATLEPQVTILVATSIATDVPTQSAQVIIVTPQAATTSSGCFCTIYTVRDDRYSGCPGIVIESGYDIPPSAILQPNSNSNQIWVYFSTTKATSGGILWRYRTEMYGEGSYASEACVRNQYQYFSQRTPIEFP